MSNCSAEAPFSWASIACCLSFGVVGMLPPSPMTICFSVAVVLE